MSLCMLPGWAGEASLSVNGVPCQDVPRPGSYASVRRRWRPGDRIELVLPMPVRFLEAHPYVPENHGRVAISRGPVLYCAEAVDHPGVDLRTLEISPERPLEAAFDPDHLGGVTVLCGTAAVRPLEPSWRDRLYRPARPAPAVDPTRAVTLAAVPYFAWGNRAPGGMRVWLLRGRS